MQQIFGIMFLICGSGFFELPQVHSAMKQYKYGDVQINVIGSILKCDRITCPSTAYRCRVTKKKEDINSNSYERNNFCYSRDNRTVGLKVTHEPSRPGKSEELDVNVTNNYDSSEDSDNGSSICTVDSMYIVLLIFHFINRVFLQSMIIR